MLMATLANTSVESLKRAAKSFSVPKDSEPSTPRLKHCISLQPHEPLPVGSGRAYRGRRASKKDARGWPSVTEFLSSTAISVMSSSNFLQMTSQSCWERCRSKLKQFRRRRQQLQEEWP